GRVGFRVGVEDLDNVAVAVQHQHPGVLGDQPRRLPPAAPRAELDRRELLAEAGAAGEPDLAIGPLAEQLQDLVALHAAGRRPLAAVGIGMTASTFLLE